MVIAGERAFRLLFCGQRQTLAETFATGANPMVEGVLEEGYGSSERRHE
jgi:hypothetical protein